MDRVRALQDRNVLPVLGELQDRVARHAGQDRTIERRRDQLACAALVLPHREGVHGADLGDVVLLAKEPEDLCEAVLGREHLRQDARRVVAVIDRERVSRLTTRSGSMRRNVPAELRVAGASRPGAHVFVRGKEVHGLEARRIVRSHGREDDVQQRRVRRADSERVLRADQRRADVERVSALARNPVLVDTQQRLEALDQLVAVKLLQRQRQHEREGAAIDEAKERVSDSCEPLGRSIVRSFVRAAGCDAPSCSSAPCCGPDGTGGSCQRRQCTPSCPRSTIEFEIEIEVEIEIEFGKVTGCARVARAASATYLDGIVETVARGAEAEVAVRHDGRRVPARVLVVLDGQHVVGERAAEHELLLGQLLLGARGLGDGQLAGLHDVREGEAPSMSRQRWSMGVRGCQSHAHPTAPRSP